MKRDDIVQTMVIAIGGSATGFALVFMVKLGIKQESLFALVGALVGAATTIGGAAWLADRNRNIERDAEVSLLVKEYHKLLKAALLAQGIAPEAGMPWPKEYRPLLYKLAEESGSVHAIAEEATGHGKALSFIHRAAVRRVQFAIDEYLRFWTDASAEGELEPDDERSFPFVTADIVDECKRAIAALARETSFADKN